MKIYEPCEITAAVCCYLIHVGETLCSEAEKAETKKTFIFSDLDRGEFGISL